jgi:DNA invertase Pin-like site-specific DNA recombinase
MKKSIEFYRDAYDKFTKMNGRMKRIEIARALDVDPATISAWKRGRLPDGVNTPLDKATLEAAESMLDEGYSYTATAKYLSVGVYTLRRHFPNKGYANGGKLTVDFSLDEYV